MLVVAFLLVIAAVAFLQIQREKPDPEASKTGVTKSIGPHPQAASPAVEPIPLESVGRGKCAAEIKPQSELGEGDRCVLKLMANRCGNLDPCFVQCFASGSARNIGGGCYHMCNYSLWKPWSLPAGWEKCYAPGEKNHLG